MATLYKRRYGRPAEMKDFLTTLEGAEYLGMGRSTLSHLLTKGVIPFYRNPYGHEYLLRKEDLDKFMAKKFSDVGFGQSNSQQNISDQCNSSTTIEEKVEDKSDLYIQLKGIDPETRSLLLQTIKDGLSVELMAEIKINP